MTGTDDTRAAQQREWQRAYHARRTSAGLKRLSVWVPDTKEAKDQIQNAAARLRGDKDQ